MSLDVYLRGPERPDSHFCAECGQEHTGSTRPTLYKANITHNLGAMAERAGIYQHLWRPEELGIAKARDLIEPLRTGVALLKSDRQRFEKFNSPNGWGLYEHFVPFVEAYLAACEEYPDADVEVSR